MTKLTLEISINLYQIELLTGKMTYVILSAKGYCAFKREIYTAEAVFIASALFFIWQTYKSLGKRYETTRIWNGIHVYTGR